VGSPATVRAGLEEVAREYGTEELMLLTITYEHEARRRSYELIAEVMQQPLLGAPPGAAPS
jgi:alkanesulfonate monooxygenase SsuD/methylene tetrahydromethanopterin reductase-like flavin-dependent oxidoreductase (luciferase family)